MAGSIYVAVPGGLRGQGGIDRQMQYFFEGAAALGLDDRLTPFATRGTGSLAVSMVLLPFRLARYAAHCALGRVSLLHANVSVSGSTYRKMCLVLISRLFAVPVVLHLHGSEYRAFFARLTGLRRTAVMRMFGASDRVVVLGTAWRNFVVGELGVPPERTAIIPNAVPAPRRRREPSADKPPHLLFLGRLGDRKRVGDLLEALAMPAVRALDWTATVAGDGDVERYRAQARSLGLDGRIRFPGWTGPDETDRLLATADVMVLPSEAENLPMSILEGMANGLAIVATPVGAVPEVIQPGVNGCLVPVGDVEALSIALRDLISDCAIRERLGAGARAVYQERFAIESYVRQLFALYAEIAEQRTGRSAYRARPQY